ncbi:MAG: DNA topoisomerase IB [Actinomycetota bacterium]|nr:DNA topoisomerase IB [Actinomycetota bacterium]
MARLRTVSPNSKGWTRRRSGKGFVYLDQYGERLDTEDSTRCRSLVIPPAWENVWICPFPNGHIQCVGVDAAGRRQYLYHPDWRTKRDQLKFDRVAQVAAQLPRARAAILEHIALDGMPMKRAAATAVRLLDLGYFRIGSDSYADANGSFGLTTLQKRHVRRSRDRLVFCFTGKSGIEHCIEIDDPLAVSAVETMRRRRGSPEDELLAYRNGRRWMDVDAATVNDYLRATTGAEITAKDFRTWHATVLAAASLASTDEHGKSAASRKRAVRRAVVEVAQYLGNTPTVAKSSYIDPRVLDLYEDGTTIAPTPPRTYDSPDERQSALERAVLRMLSEDAESTSRVARTRSR